MILLTIFFIATYSIPIHEFQGFGADANYSIFLDVVVTDQLSFRSAVQENSAHIKFGVSFIILNSPMFIKSKKNIIIEGIVDLYNYGIYIEDSQNVIVYNLRVLNASIYGVLVFQSKNVILDHLTIIDASRQSVDKGKCIDITEATSNVTISYSILGYTSPLQKLIKYKGMLIANFTKELVTNVSIHHNIFYQNYQRSPEISSPGLFDMVNNIILRYTEYGSRVRDQAEGNFLNNYFLGGKKDPLVFITPESGIYSEGNLWKKEQKIWMSINNTITHQYFVVPTVKKFNWEELKKEVVSGIGCLGKGSIERKIRNEVMEE